MNPREGYEHLNTPWMNMKVGDLVSIIWTESTGLEPIVGVVTALGPHQPLLEGDRRITHIEHLEHLSRQKIEIFSQGKSTRIERGSLKVIA